MMARPRRFVSILACKKYKVLSALLAIYNLAVASASEDLIDIDPSSLAVSQSCESYKSASRALILNLRPSGGPRSSKRRTIMNTSSTTCSSLSTKHDVSLIARMKIKRNSPNLVAFAENHRPALPLVPCDHQPTRVVAAGPGGGSQPGRGGTGGVHRRRRRCRGYPPKYCGGGVFTSDARGLCLGLLFFFPPDEDARPSGRPPPLSPWSFSSPPPRESRRPPVLPR